MTGRSRQILGRFPAHFEAIRQPELVPPAQPSKRLEAVVEALALELDELATDLAAVRRSHRLAHTDTFGDILRLADIHGYGPVEMDVLFQRIAWTRKIVKELRAGDDAARLAAADRLFDVWGLDTDLVLPSVEGEDEPHRLALYAPSDEDPATFHVTNASLRMALHVLDAFRHRTRIALGRRRVERICAIGNGTVRAVLETAANALDLDMDLDRNEAAKEEMAEAGLGHLHPAMHDEYFHSADRFWHASFVVDRVRLTRQVMIVEPPPAEEEGEEPPPPPEPAVDETPLAQRRNIVRLDTPYQEIGIGELARQLSKKVALVIDTAAAAGITGLDAISVIPADTASRIARLFGFDTWQVIPQAEEILGIEENPLRREYDDPEDVEHAQLDPVIEILRRGFGTALLRIRVAGVGDKTVGPMVVNRETGDGIGYVGKVPDGSQLDFNEEGRVFLDGADVTSFAYSFHGAVFAEGAGDRTRDFLFSGPDVVDKRRARFAVTQPPGALDRGARFPTAGNSVVAPPVSVGRSRFGFFVRVAHFAALDPGTPPTVRTVTPWVNAAIFEESVFAAGTEDAPVAANLSMSWLEHEAYAVRVIIPPRFAALDEGMPDDQKVPARVKRALERVRPGGVDVRVDYLNEEWILGRGRLPSEDDDDPIIRLRGGSLLAPAPEGT